MTDLGLNLVVLLQFLSNPRSVVGLASIPAMFGIGCSWNEWVIIIALFVY